MAEPRPPLFPLRAYKEAAAEFPGIDAVALYNNNALAQFARDYLTAQDKELAKYGMAMGRHITLGLLREAGERGIAPADLADRLGITRGAMTGLIDHLVRASFVKREDHPGDRRMSRIVITSEGLKKFDGYWSDHARTLCRFFNVLSKKEQKELHELTKKLAKGFVYLIE